VKGGVRGTVMGAIPGAALGALSGAAVGGLAGVGAAAPLGAIPGAGIGALGGAIPMAVINGVLGGGLTGIPAALIGAIAGAALGGNVGDTAGGLIGSIGSSLIPGLLGGKEAGTADISQFISAADQSSTGPAISPVYKITINYLEVPQDGAAVAIPKRPVTLEKLTHGQVNPSLNAMMNGDDPNTPVLGIVDPVYALARDMAKQAHGDAVIQEKDLTVQINGQQCRLSFSREYDIGKELGMLWHVNVLPKAIEAGFDCLGITSLRLYVDMGSYLNNPVESGTEVVINDGSVVPDDPSVPVQTATVMQKNLAITYDGFESEERLADWIRQVDYGALCREAGGDPAQCPVPVSGPSPSGVQTVMQGHDGTQQKEKSHGGWLERFRTGHPSNPVVPPAPSNG
jgi:hypothetical protein